MVRTKNLPGGLRKIMKKFSHNIRFMNCQPNLAPLNQDVRSNRNLITHLRRVLIKKPITTRSPASYATRRIIAMRFEVITAVKMSCWSSGLLSRVDLYMGTIVSPPFSGPPKSWYQSTDSLDLTIYYRVQ
jgi:hypothetical protein